MMIMSIVVASHPGLDSRLPRVMRGSFLMGPHCIAFSKNNFRTLLHKA